MRYTICTVALLTTLTSATYAQESAKAEIGTALGVTISIPDDGSTLTTFSVPGGSDFTGSPFLYATIFATPSVMVEPQINLTVLSGGGDTVWRTSLMGQLGYLFQPERTGSAYVAGHAGILAAGNGSSESSQAVGAAVGYRQVLGSGAAVRFEARYRRWFGDIIRDVNEITLGMAIGGVIR